MSGWAVRARSALRAAGALVVLLPLLLGSCATPGRMESAAATQPRGASVPVRMASGAEQLAAGALVDESNGARAGGGVGALVLDDALMTAAMEYARELAALRRLSHTSPLPGRTSATDRISAAGASWRSAGENLARLPGDSTSVAGRTVRMWLNSPGHRRNLLNPVYTHTGVGVAQDAAGDWWVVQLYTLPR